VRAHYEVTLLPGLEEQVAAEVRAATGAVAEPVPGRDDALRFSCRGPHRPLSLRTAVAVFALLTFPVPRPKSLLSGEYFPAIVDAVRRVDGATSFRFDAAGAGSSVFTRLAEQLAAATRLPHDPLDGDVVLRFRRSSEADGWDVLVRLSTRPLSHRAWRVRNVPGAVNATIAAAMAAMTGPRPDDRVVNLMCGSGTLLIERLLHRRAQVAVGVDDDPAMLAACTENLAAAGLRADLRKADVTGDGWLDTGPFDVLLADPPWGTLVGSHAGNEELHLGLLQRARDAAAPHARFAVLTHEIRQMERCLRQVEGRWRVDSVTRVYQKGHHPRIYLLRPSERS
jgi:tRNA (guanine6-N2)-methyltransferase